MEFRFVYITCKDKNEALSVGKGLVSDHLAACVNILDGMQSIYWWKGKIEVDTETVLIAKTRASLVPALTEKVKHLHSYEVPCVVTLPILEGNPDYLKWLARETQRSK